VTYKAPFCAVLLLLTATPAGAAVALLPPAQYDHPFDGTLTVLEDLDPEEVSRLCGGSGNIACAAPPEVSGAHKCTIYMAEPVHIQAKGWSVETVRRHEVGHCNGWPNDHGGARTIAQAEAQRVEQAEVEQMAAVEPPSQIRRQPKPPPRQTAPPPPRSPDVVGGLINVLLWPLGLRLP
jgi:hypothetical protein